MGYRFRLSESVEAGVRRIGREQFSVALGELQKPTVGPENVHTCRKSIKKLRSLLRLVRPAMARNVWRKHNVGLRDTARLLSQQRDKAVMSDTLTLLETISEKRNISGATAALKALRQIIGSDVEDDAHELEAVTAAEARRRLRREARRFQSIAVPGHRKDILAEGIADAYRTAQRAIADAQASTDAEAFHEVRKAVQWHWRHMSLLDKAWPDIMSVRASEARDISQLLGEDHDLSLLAKQTIDQAGLTDISKRVILELCQTRQDEIRADVDIRLGRLFIERPEDFGERIAQYWGEARRTHRLHGKARRNETAGKKPAKRKKKAARSKAGGEKIAK